MARDGVPPISRPTSPGRSAAPTADRPRPTPPEPVIDEDGLIAGLPPIEAEPAVLDFGFIPPREARRGAFKLWNRGTSPLTILMVQPSCKCTTTSDLADKVIPPGEFLELEAELEGAPLPSPRKATIKILVDGYSRVLELELKGEVAYPLRSPPGYLNVVSGQEQKGRIVVESIDRQPFRICQVQGEAPVYIGFDPTKDEPRAQYLLSWDMEKYQGKPPAYWVIETDRPDCPVLPVRVRHETTIPRPVFRLKEYSVNLGRVEPGKPTDVEVLMEDTGEVLIAAAAISEHARAELVGSEKIDGVVHARIRVTARPEFEGFLFFPLALYSASKEMEIPAFGVARSSGKSGCGS